MPPSLREWLPDDHLAYFVSDFLILYIGLQTVAQGVLGPELANQTEAPLAAAAVEVFGGWGGRMLLAGVVISIYGAVSGDMLGAPRVIFASALDDNLPRFLSKVHPKYKTPHVAVIFFAAVVCAFALSGTFRYLAVFATGSLLLIDLGVDLCSPCCACAAVTARPEPESSDCHSGPSFRC